MSKGNILAVGTFVGTSKGFGFVELHENNGADDIFIPPHFVCGALHGDEVEVRLESDPRSEMAKPQGKLVRKSRRGNKPPAPKTEEPNKRQMGRITQIIKRGAFLGTFFTEGTQSYVKPMENKIPYFFAVPPKSRNRFNLADGHRVLFSVDKKSRPEDEQVSCFITEVLGHMNDPGVDVLTLVRQAGIPYEWPQEVLDEVKKVPKEVEEEAKENRADLRDWLICTIDGDDTKDIDDAISLTKTPAGLLQLGVHIADVTHYVAENAPLDKEALHRGTSVYLADRVIPMLPHELSSGICSLFPEVDRLAMSCIMTVDDGGQVVEYEIKPTLIRSKRRWTYDEVENLLADAEKGNAPDDEWLTLFTRLNRLRAVLYEKRRARGALDFDLPEAKIRVDESGKPISIEPYARNRATGMIEECMILCNETIATHCLTKKMSCVFRTHEPPNAMKLAQLNETTRNYGVSVPPVANKPKVLQKVLAAVAGTPAAYAVSNAILRALPQAHYTPDNPTHYGLASEAYCHFTSPIRRYADLQTHRILKRLGDLNFKQRLPAVCAQASRTERAAEALEREVSQMKKVQFMEGFEGNEFTGIVSGITPWGIFIMLPNTVEGMVPIEAIKKSGLRYDKTRKCYVSRRNRPALTPGTELTVKLLHADAEERRITFGF